MTIEDHDFHDKPYHHVPRWLIIAFAIALSASVTWVLAECLHP